MSFAAVDGLTRPPGTETAAGLPVLQGPKRETIAPDLLAQIEAVAAGSPHATAVEAKDGNLTYRELLDRVAQVRRALEAEGVRPGDLVGISLARGCRELVTMLATLAAGAAYVPLDLSLPGERRALILEDAAPVVWVREAPTSLAEAPPAAAGAEASGPRTWIFPRWDDLPPMPASPAPRAGGGEDPLAYVLFTSGSTGRPKGVEVRRAAFQSFLRAMAHEPGFAAGQRLLAVSTTSFDISGLELFLPLWVGGTTVIADRETVRDPAAWARALDDKRIDCLQATPSGWRLLLDAGWKGRPGLKMFCGGEPLTEALAARLLEKGAELWNLYGPTETTVWSTLTRITDPREITVGRPIDDTLIAILDADGQPSRPEVEGEIGIAGVGLARGYRRRTDLTTAAFVSAAWLPDGGRIYKTGDRGLLTRDGRLVCLGRRDGQVKILGHRIELGEVERALRTAPGVGEVVVLAEHVGERDARLAAYWEGAATAAELESRARALLPAYMVPARYVHVPAFPLNPNGKIDRKALAKLEIASEEASAPATPTGGLDGDWDIFIAATWADLLKRQRVGLDEDVFRLGATSLLVADLHQRVQAMLGRPFPLAAVFEARSPRELARKLGETATGDESIIVRLRQGPATVTPLYCVMGVALYRDLATALPHDRDVYAMDVRVPRAEQTGTFEGVITATAKAYVAAIRKLQPHGPYALLGLCYGGIVAFEAARQLVAAGETVESVTILDAVLPEGVIIDQRARVRSHLRRALRQPGQWSKEVWQTLTQQLKTHPLWLRARGLPPTRSEIPVDGPEADRAIAAFAHNRTSLAVPTLVVRATRAPVADWMRLRSDLGWQALAPAHRVLELDTGHLELLRPPFVAALAEALTGLGRPR